MKINATRKEVNERSKNVDSNINYILAATIAFVLVSALILGCTYLNQRLGIKDDSIGEELIEEIIESQTGINFDLTPLSPED